MSLAYLIKGNRVNLQIYPNGLLNISYNNVLIGSDLDYEDAKSFEDVDAYHKAMYPSLPVNSASADPSQLNYLRVRTLGGETFTLAREWMVPTSVSVMGTVNASVPLINVSPTQRDLIREVLVGAGFTVGEITFGS
jgi:hypothetical protein